MKIEKAIEVFREMLDETRQDDGTMCNQPYYCKAFRKDRERTNKCPFCTCEVCERIVAFDTIVDFVNKASADIAARSRKEAQSKRGKEDEMKGETK